jgi:TolA-binding protein
LCVLLAGALWVAATPQWLHQAWLWVDPDPTADLPLVPADILLRGATVAETRGDLEESLRLYRMFTEQHPQHSGVEDALAQMARQQLALGDLDAASDIYRELRMRFPDSALQRPLLRQLAEVEFVNGRVEDAMRSYKDLVGLAIRSEIGRSTEDSAPRSAAERTALKARDDRIEQERNEMERLARFNLALCQEKTSHPSAAIRAYERFVRRFPTDARVAEARYRMGALHLELGHVREARHHFEPLCLQEDIAPMLRAASIYHAGRCSEKLMELDEARRFYQLATALTPQSDDYRLASLERLARLLEKPEPLRAREVYRDLASHSDNSVRRAIARQRFVALQGEATVAATLPEVEE